MPKIPGYNQRTNAPDAVATPKYTSDQFGGGVAAAEVGRVVSDAFDNYQKVQKQQEDLWLEKTTAEKQNYWSAELERRKQAAEPGAANFTPTILADYDADMQKAIEEAGSERLKAELTNKSLKLRGALQTDSMMFESQSMHEKQKLDVGSIIDLNANTLFNKPSQFNDVATNTFSAIDNSGLMPIVKEKMKADAKNTLALSALQGTMQINPWAAKKQLDSGQWDTYLDPRAKISLSSATENEIERRKREAEAKAVESFKKNFLVQNKFTTLEEDSATLERLTADGNDEISGFAHRVIAEKQKVLANDPAAYVLTSPNVIMAAQDYQATAQAAQASNNPAMMQEANGKRDRLYQAIMDEQTRLGVTVPKIVTAQQANQIKQIVQNPAGSADDIIKAVATVEQQFGSMAPRAFAELTKEGVPEYINIIGSMDLPNQSQARESLARAIRKGPTELSKSIPSGDLTLITKAIDEEMGDITKAFGSRQGGDSIVSNYRSTAKLLAMQYYLEGKNDSARYGNKAVNDFGRAAIQDIVKSKYNFATTYAVPVVAGNIAIDPEDVQNQLFRIKQNIGIRDLMVPKDVPQDIGKEGYRDAVVNNGYWANNPTDDGLILYDQRGTPVIDEARARLDKDGRLLNMNEATIQVKFDDLQIQANKEKAAQGDLKEFIGLNYGHWAPSKAQFDAADEKTKAALKRQIKAHVEYMQKYKPNPDQTLMDAVDIQNKNAERQYRNSAGKQIKGTIGTTSVYMKIPDWAQ